jgi:hypothetical protein
MSESALDKLKSEAKEKELARKAKSIQREQVKRKKTKHVQLMGVLYIEPLAPREPTIENIRVF